MQHKKTVKTKFISIRVTDDELKQIQSIQLGYTQNGMSINRSKIVRDVLLNLDKV